MNKKSLILSSVIAGLTLLFTILAVVPLEGLSLLSFGLFYLEYAAESPEALVYGLPLVMAFVLTVVTLVFSILSILTACNVIKSAKAAKAFRIVEVVLASITTLCSLLVILFVVDGAYTFVLFPVLAIATLVLVSVDLHGVRKAAKAESEVKPENEVQA